MTNYMAPQNVETKHTNWLLIGIAFLVTAVITGLVIYLGIQRSDLADAKAETAAAEKQIAQVTDERDQARASQDEAETDLADANQTIADTKDQLGLCAYVVEISDHQWTESSLLLDSLSKYADSDYVGALNTVRQAGDHIDDIGVILTRSGYKKDVDGLWAACAPSFSSL